LRKHGQRERKNKTKEAKKAFFPFAHIFTVFSLAIFHCFSYKLGGCVSSDVQLRPDTHQCTCTHLHAGALLSASLSSYIQTHANASACTGMPALSCKNKEMSGLCPFGFKHTT
jgi:hypothetical protein